MLAASSISWLQSGELHAEKNVNLLFKLEKGAGENFSEPIQKKTKQALESQEKYSLNSQYLYAQIDPKEKVLKSFRSHGKVNIKKILEQNPKNNPIQEELCGDYLLYENQKAIFHGNPCEILYQGNRMLGRELIWDEKTKQVICEMPEKVILSNISSQKNLLPDETLEKKQQISSIEIVCDGPIKFLQEKSEVEFHKNVKIQAEQGTLYCNLLKVILEKQEVSAMIAHEKIKFISGENTILADQVYWNEKEQIATLTGYPYARLESKDFSMQSPTVWYHIPTKRFSTRGKGILLRRAETP
jgi:lipopolysaccharide assembly outer membrane protein LptD (OstA)